MTVRENCERIRAEVPDYVTIVAAAKTRTAEEIKELIDAGVDDIGENYVQETEEIRTRLGRDADRLRWHLIGHLQTNKVNKALDLFEVMQALDSVKLARAINKRAKTAVSVLIEINSAREPQKTGVLPEEVEQMIRTIAPLEKISIKRLMAMGPRFGDHEDARPYFQKMKKLFERIASPAIPGVEMDILSMGISNAYRVATEEVITMIRPGTILFGKRGPRQYRYVHGCPGEYKFVSATFLEGKS
jgi:PLP dependent protein